MLLKLIMSHLHMNAHIYLVAHSSDCRYNTMREGLNWNLSLVHVNTGFTKFCYDAANLRFIFREFLC